MLEMLDTTWTLYVTQRLQMTQNKKAYTYNEISQLQTVLYLGILSLPGPQKDHIRVTDGEKGGTDTR